MSKLTKEEVRKGLADINTDFKILEERKKLFLSELRVEGKEYITKEMLEDITLNFYDSIDDDEITMMDVIEWVLSNMHDKDIDFFTERKNERFPYRIGKVIFDNLEKNPVQRMLRRKKHVRKSEVNRTTTPNQYVNQVERAKVSYSQENRMNKLEEDLRIERAKRESSVEELSKRLDSITEGVRKELEGLYEGQEESIRVKAYLLKQQGMTHKQVGKTLDIGESTSRKYCKWVKDNLGSSEEP